MRRYWLFVFKVIVRVIGLSNVNPLQRLLRGVTLCYL